MYKDGLTEVNKNYYEKKIILSILTFLVLLVVVAVWFINSMPDMKSTYNVKEVNFPKTGTSLYLKSESWGLTNDSKVIALSTNNNKEPVDDSSKNYVYEGASFIFYRASEDSLILYVPIKSNVPASFKSNVKIVQIELENSEMMKLKLEGRYKNERLLQFK